MGPSTAVTKEVWAERSAGGTRTPNHLKGSTGLNVFSESDFWGSSLGTVLVSDSSFECSSVVLISDGSSFGCSSVGSLSEGSSLGGEASAVAWSGGLEIPEAIVNENLCSSSLIALQYVNTSRHYSKR